MAEKITPYDPDLEKIAAHTKMRSPLLLDYGEYMAILRKHDLRPSAALSDAEILRAMEAGLIKVWDEDGSFDISKQIQSNNIDTRLNNGIWYYQAKGISCLDMKWTAEELKEKRVLDYDYIPDGDNYTFHPNRLYLAMTKEVVALSNGVEAHFDGASRLGRFGIQPHQAARLIHSGFMGNIALEISNQNQLDVSIPIPRNIGVLTFALLSEPSTRPRNTDPTKSWTHQQQGPLGYWDESWDEVRRKALEKKKT